MAAQVTGRLPGAPRTAKFEQGRGQGLCLPAEAGRVGRERGSGPAPAVTPAGDTHPGPLSRAQAEPPGARVGGGELSSPGVVRAVRSELTGLTFSQAARGLGSASRPLPAHPPPAASLRSPPGRAAQMRANLAGRANSLFPVLYLPEVPGNLSLAAPTLLFFPLRGDHSRSKARFVSRQTQSAAIL